MPPPQTVDQAWAIFQTLPAAQQLLLVEQVFTAVLDTTGKDYNDPASPFFHQYNRGYQAINTLFPASLWLYRRTISTGGTNGANRAGRNRHARHARLDHPDAAGRQHFDPRPGRAHSRR